MVGLALLRVPHSKTSSNYLDRFWTNEGNYSNLISSEKYRYVGIDSFNRPSRLFPKKVIFHFHVLCPTQYGAIALLRVIFIRKLYIIILDRFLEGQTKEISFPS